MSFSHLFEKVCGLEERVTTIQLTKTTNSGVDLFVSYIGSKSTDRGGKTESPERIKGKFYTSL